MNRIYKDSVVPKYPTGKWSWNPVKEELNFSSWEGKAFDHELIVPSSSGYKFKASINQIEEVIFRQEFARSTENTDDGEIIKLEDIKTLVLFLAPSEILTNKFIAFIHNKTIDRFLNALIIYFEYFLRLAEFILIRRDEVSGDNTAKIQSAESTQIKKIFSEQLSQYRLILAREYSVIIMGNGDMSPYYHLNTLVKISKTYKDRVLHEAFLAFATQVVWIAHHRRAYDTIDCEMNRLFRSHHFKLNRKDPIQFSSVEEELLYGKNNKRVNYRRQNSPLIQEISNVADQNLAILWIGEKKYRGNDLRLQQLELELVIPTSELCLIDVKHGILGNPRPLYNTMLTIVDEKLRECGDTERYDPYWLIRQPYLQVPNLEAFEEKKGREYLEYYFLMKDNRFQYCKKMMSKWRRRDSIIDYIKSGGLVIDVVEKCKRELALNKKVKLNLANITQAFLVKRKFMRKK